jgi:uncharacterized Zn-binding protein involved in type VI secretion
MRNAKRIPGTPRRVCSAGTLVRLALVFALLASSLALTGCDGWFFGGDILGWIGSYLEDYDDAGEVAEEAAEQGDVELTLTHPAGASPNVFTTGWVFGARCVVSGEDGQVDISDQVRWGGTGDFSPQQGRTSRPSFDGPGANQIVLTVEYGGETYEQTFSVSAVSPAGYACVGDQAMAPADGHGCPACPHNPKGPITSGSPNVFVRGRPAARLGDHGVHAACCGPNTFEITSGDSSVMINGRPAAKIGSDTMHCGGVGTITGG